MRCAYVGLVSRSGLEGLWPENDASRYWLRRAISDRTSKGVWAVLTPEHVVDLQLLVSAGESDLALRGLNVAAESLGSLL